MMNYVARKLSHKSGRKGFTLTELLIVVGIIAVVAAIAIPSIISISRSLKFRQMNDYAKSVYLAAQNNLTEMRSDGRLVELLSAEGAEDIPSVAAGFPTDQTGAEQYDYTSANGADNAAFNLVLPAGSIDETVRDKQILVEYNPRTGNVYAVFYSEKGAKLTYDYLNGIARQDEQVSLRAEENTKSRKKEMLGYYDGSVLGNTGLTIEETAASVSYENGEEGIVTVAVPVPAVYARSPKTFYDGLEVKLVVDREKIVSVQTKEGGITVDVKASGDSDNFALSTDGKYVLISYVLDSLKDGKSFVNLSAGTENALTSVTREDAGTFAVVPGENVTLTAEVKYSDGTENVIDIGSGMLAGVNPLFGSLVQLSDGGRYVLTLENGRNLQNLNTIAPSVAEQVEMVSFSEDINWNTTVSYYNKNYGTVGESGGKTYTNRAAEAPARALPYFVPIRSEGLFGDAFFTYPEASPASGSLWARLRQAITNAISDYTGNVDNNPNVPTLTDELDTDASSHASIQGNGKKVYYLNIDSTKYALGKAYYAGNAEADTDRFTGLFGYVNTTVDSLYVVNPIIRGYGFNGYNNPAAGALIGAAGYDTLVTNCGAYIDTEDAGFNRVLLDGQTSAVSSLSGYYSASGSQSWYGVSGEGAVGGLVGYAKSHRTVKGDLTGNLDVLAFSRSFAAVNVAGNMRGSDAKNYGYTNGVGGFIGNSELTNFYECYASGNVYGSGAYISSTYYGSSANAWGMFYEGRYCMGTGGFVGTSHGTRYTNCFSTGEVVGKSNQTNLGAGGFIGVMCYDETKAYGNVSDSGSTKIAQHTVFSSCYSVGLANCNSAYEENFSGANARIKLALDNIRAYSNADYYSLYAPYVLANGTAPTYQTDYIYKDCHYLSQYTSYGTDNDNSNKCASAAKYEELTQLHLRDGKSNAAYASAYASDQINELKKTSIFDAGGVIGRLTRTGEFFEGIFGDNWLARLGTVLWNQIQQLFTDGDPRLHYDVYFTIYNNENGANSLNNIYTNMYKSGFSSDRWGAATESGTHSYALNSAGKVYPFSMFRGMDYYGNWPSEPRTAGLAYYEYYHDAVSGSARYGFYFDEDRTSSLPEGSEAVLSDGYAVLTTGSTDTVTFTAYDKAGNVLSSGRAEYLQDFTPKEDVNRPGTKKYCVYLLPASVLKAAEDDFYTRLVVSVNGTAYTMYFNPNVALTQVNPARGSSTAARPSRAPSQLYIRSARQLAALGTEGMEDYLGANYHYYQMKNISFDANVYTAGSYTGTGKDDILATLTDLSPIGTEEKPFNGIYSGAGGYTEQAEVANYCADGLFGVIGTGTVSDLKLLNPAAPAAGESGTAADTPENAGILAGSSGGTVKNVDIELTRGVVLEAEKSAGALLGENSGTVENCSVTSGQSVTLMAENAGGLIGSSAGGTLTQLTAELADVKVQSAGTAPVKLAGLVFGSLADTELQQLTAEGKVSGTAEKLGGFAGSVTGSTVTQAAVTLKGTNGGTETVGLAGGFAAVVESSALTDANLTMASGASLKDGEAAGYAGELTEVTLTNCTASVGEITCTGDAAGFALQADSASLISGCSAVLKGEIITDGGNAAGFIVDLTATVNGGGVELAGGTVSGKTAAGYTLELKAGANITASDVTGRGTIRATEGDAAGYTLMADANISGSHVGMNELTVNGAQNAAGFAITVAEGRTLNACYVDGSGQIKADNGSAAGFAVENAGTVKSSMVTPGRHTTGADLAEVYLAASVGKLKVSAPNGDAAGFAVMNSGAIADSTAVGTVSGTGAAGFVLENSNEIKTCIANTVASGGSALVGRNMGTVADSYAWVSGGTPDALDEGETGTYVSCYMAKLNYSNGVPGAVSDAVVYPAMSRSATAGGITVVGTGTAALSCSPPDITADMLNTAEGTTWVMAHNGYPEQYPFSSVLTADSLKEYPYPMLRAHYGDWSIEPVSYYGLAYYEKGSDGSYQVEIADISRSAFTGLSLAKTDAFADAENGPDTIVDAGYILICKDLSDFGTIKKVNGETVAAANITAGELPADFTLTTLGANAAASLQGYSLIRISDSMPIGSIADKESGTAVTLNSLFAQTIGMSADASLQVRTAQQLKNVGQMPNGDFLQSYPIVLDAATGIGNFTGIYDGNQYTVTAAEDLALSGTGLFAQTVSGEVKNLTLQAGNVTASGNAGLVAGTLSGTLENVKANADITVSGANATVGGLVGTVSGGTVKSCRAEGSLSAGEGFAADSGRVGGAVGAETAGGENKARYEDTTAKMTMSAVLADGYATVTPDCPAGKGSVGRFIGHAEDGSFVSCSGTEAGETVEGAYSFLGTAACETQTLTNAYRAETGVTGTVTGRKLSADDSSYSNAEGTTDGFFTLAQGETAAHTYALTLDNCSFTDADGSVKYLTIGIDGYYYSKNTDNRPVNEYTIARETSSLANGTYIVTNKDARYALRDNNGSLSAVDLGSALAAATLSQADYDALLAKGKILWTYDGSSWKNQTEKYLRVERNYGNYVELTGSAYTGIKIDAVDSYFTFYHTHKVVINYYCRMLIDGTSVSGENDSSPNDKEKLSIFSVTTSTKYYLADFSFTRENQVLQVTAN